MRSTTARSKMIDLSSALTPPERELLLGLLDEADAVVGVLGHQRHPLEPLLLDPAVPDLHAVGIDDVRSERVVQVLLGELLRRGLRREHGDLELLGEVLHRVHHRAVELADHRADLVLRGQLPEAGDALLRRPRVVLDDQLDLPAAEHAALGVDLVGGHLRPADDELAGGGITGGGQWRQHADLDGALGEGRRGDQERGRRPRTSLLRGICASWVSST